MKKIIVTNNEANQRLDKLLSKLLNEASKGFIYKMLRKKNIVLNDKKATGTESLKIGDNIKIYLSDETFNKFSKHEFKTAKAELDIVYEDENFIFVNKPCGLLSQKAKKDDISINEMLISYMLEKGELEREKLESFKPGVCNRLDRNTSGIIIFGKTLSALQTMSELLRTRTIDKYYYCLVEGIIEKPALIEGFLVKDKNNKVYINQSKSEDDLKNAIKTSYEPLAANNNLTLLKVKLITGKTHQIRAHLASINHPLIGDYKYGKKAINDFFKDKYKLESQLLHCEEIHFNEMEGDFKYLQNKTFICDINDKFKEILKGENICLPGNPEV